MNKIIAPNWRNCQELAPHKQRRRKDAESKIASVDSVKGLYFDYRIQDGDEIMRSVRVVDDGKHTFIEMRPPLIGKHQC
jgi:hypothetical protein